MRHAKIQEIATHSGGDKSLHQKHPGTGTDVRIIRQEH